MNFRFYCNFPEQSEPSIDAMLDLCEDINVEIRKQAIRVKLNNLRVELYCCSQMIFMIYFEKVEPVV